MNDLLDDFEVQRLLDGKLSPEDRGLLLQFAEENPDNWRRIALAFVEEQMLREQLRGLQSLGSPIDENQAPVRARDYSSAGSSTKWMRYFAQAAVVCLMIGSAVWAGRLSVGQSNGSPDSQLTNVKSPGDYTIVLAPETQRASNGFQQLANVNYAEDNHAFERMLAPMFDQEAHVVFRNHGYTVNEEPVIYILQGRQGEQYVVPRRNVSFVAHHD